MIHNFKLNNKINFLLEANLSADTRFIQPVAFDQYQDPPYPSVNPGDMHGPPKPTYTDDDPGVPVDWDEVERIFRENSPNPGLYKRFITWVKSLERQDVGRFIVDSVLWQMFLFQLSHEYPNYFDPFQIFGNKPGNYPENFQNYPMGMPQYAPNKP